jgi:SMI1 / KNR4 family (SUKH-1)
LKPYQKLERYWIDTGVGVDTVALGEPQLEGLERKYGVRLPEDFRDYLRCSCPVDESVYDDLTCWWPLDRIKNIVDEYPHKVTDETIARDAAKYLFFADYSIWCWAWAIACGDDENRGRVAAISGRDRFVADSFAEFVDLFVQDSSKLV